MLWQLVFLQVGFFLLLVFALHKLFHGQLLGAMGRIEKLQKENLKKEDDLKRYQQEVLRVCEKKLRDADIEIQTRRAALEEELSAIRQSLQTKSALDKEALQTAILSKEKALEQRFEQESRRRAGRVASELVSHAFTDSMMQVLHHELTKELLDSLTKSLSPSVKGDKKTIKVRSAFPFSGPEREALKKRLASVVGSDVEPEEVVDGSLIAGFVLQLDQTLLDGTLKNRFDKQLKSPQ